MPLTSRTRSVAVLTGLTPQSIRCPGDERLLARPRNEKPRRRCRLVVERDLHRVLSRHVEREIDHRDDRQIQLENRIRSAWATLISPEDDHSSSSYGESQP